MAPYTKDSLFKANKRAAPGKDSSLDSVVKQILASESSLREHKTARLRELRLEKEAQRQPEEPKAKRKAAKAAH